MNQSTPVQSDGQLNGQSHGESHGQLNGQSHGELDGQSLGLAWSIKTFATLSVSELYALLQLRSEVFVVEQNCVFLDLDGSDAKALHLLGQRGGLLLAGARCFGPGVKYAEASIGRVVTHASIRGSGAPNRKIPGQGHALMRQAIAALEAKWGPQNIRLGAQMRLEKFYASHGFVKASEPYLEDGIMHIEMLRQRQL